MTTWDGLPPDTVRRIVLRRAETERLIVHRPSGVVSGVGRRLPSHLAPAVLELLIDGHLYAEPVPADPARLRVYVTESGTRLLRVLQAERDRTLAVTRAALAAWLARRPGDTPAATGEEDTDVAAMGVGRAPRSGDDRPGYREPVRPAGPAVRPRRHRVGCP